MSLLKQALSKEQMEEHDFTTKDEDVLGELKAAKHYSDSGLMLDKQTILRSLLQRHPEDFAIDSKDSRFVGLTHIPTGFKIHAPTHVGAAARGTLTKDASQAWQRALSAITSTGRRQAFGSQLLRGEIASKLGGFGIWSTLNGHPNPLMVEHGDAILSKAQSSLLGGSAPGTLPDNIRDAYRALRDTPVKPGGFQNGRQELTQSLPWADGAGEELVPVAHGGSASFINDFLSGKSKGYVGDNGVRGITVHAGEYAAAGAAARSPLYAGRAASATFDQPSMFTAKVPSKFLRKMPNDYAAVLTPEGVQHMRDIKFDSPDASRVSSSLLYQDPEFYAKADEALYQSRVGRGMPAKSAAVAEENPGDSFGNLLSDYIPFLPSGARRAGMADMMAHRMDTPSGLLVDHPMLSQTLAVGAGSLGSAALGLKGVQAAALPIAALAAVQMLKRHQIQKIQEAYEGLHTHTRLRDIKGLDEFLAPTFIDNPSDRLGRVTAYEAMKNRKFSPVGPMSEAGDALVIAGHSVGLGFPASIAAAQIDSAEADKKMRGLGLAKAATEDEHRKHHDQRNNTTLPLYLLAMLGAGAGQAGAYANFVHTLGKGKPLDHSDRQPLVDFISERHVPVVDDSSTDNAAFHGDHISAHPTSATGAVLAHEAGHAHEANESSIPGFLQRHLYGISKVMSPIAGAGSLAAGLASGSPLYGGLLGTLIGGTVGAGTLVPEATASLEGLRGLEAYHGGALAQSGDKALLTSALGTYLASSVLPSTLAGVAGGYIAKKRREEQEQDVQ